MPTYEYACRQCSHRLEVQQSFKDDPLTTCPSCDGELRKVYSPVGIAFKGSGFYKTDSRGKSSSSTSESSSSDKASSADSSAPSGDSTSSSSDSKSSESKSSSSESKAPKASSSEAKAS